jgi:hypothetical protein
MLHNRAICDLGRSPRPAKWTCPFQAYMVGLKMLPWESRSDCSCWSNLWFGLYFHKQAREITTAGKMDMPFSSVYGWVENATMGITVRRAVFFKSFAPSSPEVLYKRFHWTIKTVPFNSLSLTSATYHSNIRDDCFTKLSYNFKRQMSGWQKL